MKMLSAFTACVLATLAQGPAHATIYKSVTNHTNVNTFLTVPYTIQLNDAGATKVAFVLPAATTVAITFSAECHTDEATNPVILSILVDGHAAAPTNSATNFCADLAYGMRSITVSKPLTAGIHTIKIVAVTANVASLGYLKSSSLVVFD